jgi:hypothetical protein
MGVSQGWGELLTVLLIPSSRCGFWASSASAVGDAEGLAAGGGRGDPSGVGVPGGDASVLLERGGPGATAGGRGLAGQAVDQLGVRTRSPCGASRAYMKKGRRVRVLAVEDERTFADAIADWLRDDRHALAAGAAAKPYR